MALQKPKSPSELRYFKRIILGKSKATVWVFSPDCTKCGKSKLSVPYDEKTGRYQSRSKVLTCANCKHEELKANYKKEDALANVEYVCPFCEFSGELQIPFKRNSKKEFIFDCEKCAKEIRIGKTKTKK